MNKSPLLSLLWPQRPALHLALNTAGMNVKPDDGGSCCQAHAASTLKAPHERHRGQTRYALFPQPQIPPNAVILKSVQVFRQNPPWYLDITWKQGESKMLNSSQSFLVFKKRFMFPVKAQALLCFANGFSPQWGWWIWVHQRLGTWTTRG